MSGVFSLLCREGGTPSVESEGVGSAVGAG